MQAAEAKRGGGGGAGASVRQYSIIPYRPQRRDGLARTSTWYYNVLH